MSKYCKNNQIQYINYYNYDILKLMIEEGNMDIDNKYLIGEILKDIFGMSLLDYKKIENEIIYNFNEI